MHAQHPAAPSSGEALWCQRPKPRRARAPGRSHDGECAARRRAAPGAAGCAGWRGCTKPQPQPPILTHPHPHPHRAPRALHDEAQGWELAGPVAEQRLVVRQARRGPVKLLLSRWRGRAIGEDEGRQRRACAAAVNLPLSCCGAAVNRGAARSLAEAGPTELSCCQGRAIHRLPRSGAPAPVPRPRRRRMRARAPAAAAFESG